MFQKTKEYYEKSIKNLLDTEVSNEIKIRIIKLMIEELNNIRCIGGYFTCAYGLSSHADKLFECNYSKKAYHINSENIKIAEAFEECPYVRISSECKDIIKRLSR